MAKEKGVTRYETEGGKVTLFEIRAMEDESIDKYGLRKYVPKEKKDDE